MLSIWWLAGADAGGGGDENGGGVSASAGREFYSLGHPLCWPAGRRSGVEVGYSYATLLGGS